MRNKTSKQIVAVIGPDGAGKSTLINQLIDRAPSLYKSIYLGHLDEKKYPNRLIIKLNNHLERKYFTMFKSSSILGLTIRLLSCFLRYLNLVSVLSETLRDTEAFILVADRYPYDYLLRTRRVRFYRFQEMLYYRLFPKPDKIVLLTGDAIAIHRRKPELFVDEIQETIDRYKSFLKQKGLSYVSVDTTACKDNSFEVDQYIRGRGKNKVE